MNIKLIIYLSILALLCYTIFNSVYAFLILVPIPVFVLSKFDLTFFHKEKKFKTIHLKLTIYMAILMFIVFFLKSDLSIFVTATPFVYKPQTFNETNNLLVITTYFDAEQKIIMRANVTNQGGAAISKVILNLTDANNALKLTNSIMTNTGLICPGVATCNIWEKNYTLLAGDSAGNWKINITANDTENVKAKNSTNFTVRITVSITLSTVLQSGVEFGTVYSNTVFPAFNNTNDPLGGTWYNITLSTTSTSNAEFYGRLNQTISNVVLNESSSIANSTHNFTTNTTISDGSKWYLFGNTTLNCKNIAPGNSCWIKFYMDLSNAVDGYIDRKLEICANATSGTTKC